LLDDEGWARIEKRLSTGEITDFAYAVHAIADFYAHTLYADVAQQPDGILPLYDPESGIPADKLVYDFSQFPNLPGCENSHAEAQAFWRGQID